MTHIQDLLLLPFYLYSLKKDRHLFSKQIAAWSSRRRRSLVGRILKFLAHA